jgi:predicted dehydrogenase
LLVAWVQGTIRQQEELTYKPEDFIKIIDRSVFQKGHLMSVRPDRRKFLKRVVGGSLAVTCGGFFSEAAGARQKPSSEKLNIGAIGVANRGSVNIDNVSGENLVALCDVDERFLGEMAQRYPRAKTFHDFRKLLEQSNLDAIVISTPDHTHAQIAVMAMRRGLHVYCEKPLAHCVHEVRLVQRVAEEQKVVTQMGNQHHASDGYRRAMELIGSGVIGAVKEVHAWSNRPIWPQGIERPGDEPPVPKYLHWDLWLGSAPPRPYHAAYHPLNWRGWWDFGCGALGDMGPHLIDPAFAALKLTYPETVEAESSPVNDETAPQWSIVRFEFPARGAMPPVQMAWYDGGKQPPQSVTGVRRPPPNGCMLFGERAKLFYADLGGRPILIPNAKGDRVEVPSSSLPVTPSHQQQWIDACKTGGLTSSDFSYGGRLTETCLLGNVAIRTGKRLEWNAETMTVTNCPEAAAYIRRRYRSGWEL